MRKWIVAALVLVLVFGSAVPAFAVTHRHGKPVFVQHPYTAKQKMKPDVACRTWGYIAPRQSDLTSKTVDILVFAYKGRNRWEQTLTVSAEVYNAARPKNQTKYRAMITLSALGRYRMRARYSWYDGNGVLHMKLSSWKYFRIVKRR